MEYLADDGSSGFLGGVEHRRAQNDGSLSLSRLQERVEQNVATQCFQSSSPPFGKYRLGNYRLDTENTQTASVPVSDVPTNNFLPDAQTPHPTIPRQPSRSSTPQCVRPFPVIPANAVIQRGASPASHASATPAQSRAKPGHAYLHSPALAGSHHARTLAHS